MRSVLLRDDRVPTRTFVYINQKVYLPIKITQIFQSSDESIFLLICAYFKSSIASVDDL